MPEPAPNPLPRTGAYGLHLVGPDLPAHRLVRVADDAPTWKVALTAAVPGEADAGFRGNADTPNLQREQLAGTALRDAIASDGLEGAGRDEPLARPADSELSDESPLTIDLRDDGAEIRLGSAALRLDRAARSAVITPDVSLEHEFIAHPYAAGIAACAAHWSGALALHGGAVVIGGRAIAILADRSEGKSTTLAALSAAGHQILTDDLIIIDSALRVLAGPRSLDLRSPHPQFPDAIELHRPGRRDRFRIDPGPSPASAPLAGVLRLSWSQGPAGLLDIEAGGERLAFLAASRTIYGAPGANGSLLLDVAALPFALLHRPRHLGSLPSAVAAIEQFSAACE